MMKRILSGAVFAAALLYTSVGYAWDGEWTRAHSMRDVYDDPNSSHHKAGTDPPQKFYSSTPRDYVDEDPEELRDYFRRYRKDYAPYALARIIYNLQYADWKIPKGYYLVKVGQWGDGSPDVHLNKPGSPGKPVLTADETTPPEADAQTEPAPVPSTGKNNITNPPISKQDMTAEAKKSREAGYQVFLFKRMGRVIAVVPIHRVESYRPPHKEHIPRHALAWVEMENRRPVFKFYYKHHIYTTEFQ